MGKLNRSLGLLVVLGAFLLAATNLRADIVEAGINGGAEATLPYVQGAYTFTYTDLGVGPDTTLQDVTAVYTDVAGLGVLNVTDICAQLSVTAASPCQAVAFDFTNLTLGGADLIESLGTVATDVSGNIANIDSGASIGGGDAIVHFGGTPPPTPSPVPEPGTLSLMLTGLLAAGGAAGRKLLSAASLA